MRSKLVRIASFVALLAVAAPLAAADTDHRPSDVPTQILPRAGGSKLDAALTRLNAIVDAEKAMRLQPGAQSRVYVQSGPAKGTLVMYHGFSAGTWQFEILARRAYAAGYNVYIPRLPGHGLQAAAGGEDSSQLLTGRTWREYETFADSTFQDVQGLGAPVIAVGLSVGGAVALSAAQQHPEIARVAVCAPFLDAAGPTKVALRVGGALSAISLGLAGKVFGLFPVKWSRDIREKTASGERPGHTTFNPSSIYAVTLFGRDIVENAAELKAPVQFITTAGDPAASESTIRQLYDRAGGAARHGWYQYPKAEKVPHAMIHPFEDNGAGHTPALYDLIMQFVETGKRSDR